MSGRTVEGTLSTYINVRSHFQRSVNLERDSDADLANYYIPTASAIDTIRRWALAMVEDNRPRAWSITGPYGSGKSSFALFLKALANGAGSTARKAAEHTLSQIDSDVVNLLDLGRTRLGLGDRGFIRAVVTAQREPAAASIMRALRVGAHAYWPTRMPRAVADALTTASKVPTAKDVLTALKALGAQAPVLLVIDEFGKNLEAFADAGADADLFVLQEVAEKISGEAGLRVFLFTLQHLAFTDYASGLSDQQRREWSKVQGRFEDVPFLDSVDQAVHVLSGAFDHSFLPKQLAQRVVRWATALWESYSDLGLATYFGDTPELIAACYPLHPLVVLALPELCARYAQHSRTLFSFVAGREPGSVTSFMNAAAISDQLPVVTLEDVYRYFIESAGSMIAASSEGSRWLEIERRLRETQGLTGEEERCLRAIAILNLVSSGGALRASMGALTTAMATDRDPLERARTMGVVHALEERGLITYREFADEYRIWHGTDFDVTAALAEARERLRGHSIAAILEQVASLAPVVAARHSQRTGMLRHFPVRFADEHTEALEIPVGADGLLVYQLGEIAQSLTKALRRESRPVVFATSKNSASLRDAGLDLAAHHDVLARSSALATDWVARREVQEREAVARQRLGDLLRDGLSAADSTRVLANSGALLDSKVGLVKLISDLCDRFYRAAPEVKNEMIARRELTSQGAMARRELLNAMVANQSLERLGLIGYGPERAMYEAVLFWPGLHRLTSQGFWAFQPPERGNSWEGAWDTVTKHLEAAKTRHVSAVEIWQALVAPPVGLKEGVLPVIFTAAILYSADEVAVYQDGTYQPVIDAAVIERLLKSPERFSVKAVGLGAARAAVVGDISRAVGITVRPLAKRRNWTVLSVMAPLLTRLRAVPAHGHYTRRLSPEAIAVRQALSTAREPDQLLFVDLPKACGVGPFLADSSDDPGKAAFFAERLHELLGELEAAYPRLLGQIHDALVREFDVPAGRSLREDLRARASHLVDKVIDPKLRAPLLMACEPNMDDQEWLEAMAMTIGERPPQVWRDEEFEQFQHNLHAVATAVARVEALYFEHRAGQREGFDARRITVTVPDGSEVSRVVWIDQSLESRVEKVAAEALRAIDERIGVESRAALLAVLAKHLYAENQAEAPNVKSNQPERGMSNA